MAANNNIKGGSEESENGSRDTGSTSTEATGDGESSVSVRAGKCKWFNVLKGFGFIIPDDGGPEVFVHQSVLQMPGFRSLDEGEPLEFQCKQTARGWEATFVAGPSGTSCRGSKVRPLGKRKHKKIRCFNCGQYGNHTASKCKQGPLPKCCYECKSTDHLVAECPNRQSASSANSNHLDSHQQVKDTTSAASSMSAESC